MYLAVLLAPDVSLVVPSCFTRSRCILDVPSCLLLTPEASLVVPSCLLLTPESSLVVPSCLLLATQGKGKDMLALFKRVTQHTRKGILVLKNGS